MVPSSNSDASPLQNLNNVWFDFIFKITMSMIIFADNGQATQLQAAGGDNTFKVGLVPKFNRTVIANATGS